MTKCLSMLFLVGLAVSQDKPASATKVHQLIDIVSKNGNLLLNVGPRSDGTIPEDVQKVLDRGVRTS